MAITLLDIRPGELKKKQVVVEIILKINFPESVINVSTLFSIKYIQALCISR